MKIYSETEDVSKLRQWMIKDIHHKLTKYTKKISELEATKQEINNISDADLLHKLVTNS